MRDIEPNRDRGPDTQHRSAWSDAEIARLKRLAGRCVGRGELESLFPGRTLATVKVRLYSIRRELGLTHPTLKDHPLISGPPMLDPNDPGIRDDWLPAWRRKAVDSNRAFLAALQAA
jgi:hypothetical protein